MHKLLLYVSPRRRGCLEYNKRNELTSPVDLDRYVDAGRVVADLLAELGAVLVVRVTLIDLLSVNMLQIIQLQQDKTLFDKKD